MKNISLLLFLLFPPGAFSWPNGPAGNAQTDHANECDSPPYSTHDFVADHGLMLLPENERAWIMPFRSVYLLGTEAPDNDDIPESCNTPNQGYDDRRQGHSVEWNSNFTNFVEHDGVIRDRAARRAQEEYNKAVIAFERGNLRNSAFYLGAMAHYIGDTSQFGHSVPFEENHSNYENWSKTRAASFNADLKAYISLDCLVRRRAYTAAKRISKATAQGQGNILSASVMDSKYGSGNRNSEFMDSVGASVNLGANEIADVLHTFYLNVVQDSL